MSHTSPLLRIALSLSAIGLMAVSNPLPAGSYGAGLQNSQWYLSESIFDCALTHDIPGYGRAVFSHRAGENLQFYLEAEVPLMRAGRGMLAVEAPAWRPGAGTRKLGYVDVEEGRRVVSVAYPESMMLVQGLLDGMAPTLTRQSAYGSDAVRVRLSNINFKPGYQGYRQCVSTLLPVNYDQIRRSRIPFASGSARLSDGDRKRLDLIVTYVLADSTVELVFVDGHTDRIGSRIQNRAISEDRARVVADYLIDAGIAEDQVIVRAHADQFPVSRNAADNRRTTIRLQRQGERPEMQQAEGVSGGGFSG